VAKKDLLWGSPEQPTRGPKPGLSVERIVQAAIKIADAEGIQAVSMQRVAAEFGFTTMSLYRYVPGKHELIDLMLDTAVGEPPDLGSVPGGWRPRLREWAHRTAAVFQRHPWFLATATGRTMGPNQLGWLECAVAALAGSGLTGEPLVESVLLVNGHVRSTAPFLVPGGAQGAGTEAWAASLVDLMRTHRDRFPALNEAIDAGAFGPPVPGRPDGTLDFGLDRIFDGIEALIAR
jgi:AcrR family transcriptional regulator